jgi:TrmH family RNA methyltransferase
VPMAMGLSSMNIFLLMPVAALKMDVVSTCVMMRNIRRMSSNRLHICGNIITHTPVSCFASSSKYLRNTPHFPSYTNRLVGDSGIKYPSILMASSMPAHSWGEITNYKTSKTVKLFKSVHRANKSKRSELGLTVAEGVRLVTDILSNEKSRHLVRRIVVSESLSRYGYGEEKDREINQYQQKLLHWLHIVDEESRQRNVQSTASGADGTGSVVAACSINVGNDEVVSACSGTVTSQGVVALVEIPPPYDPNSTSDSAVNEVRMAAQKVHPPFYLILDGLSDPGNVGSLLRACAASYVSALILLPGSCDVWNPKVVRSAMGASFRIPILEIGKSDESQDQFDQLLDYLKCCSVDSRRVYAATMEVSGDNASLSHYDIDFTCKGGGAAVILGAEGEGLRSDVRNAIQRGKISTVHVPMAPGMESLNAGVCGGIIMFERMRQLSTNAE